MSAAAVEGKIISSVNALILDWTSMLSLGIEKLNAVADKDAYDGDKPTGSENAAALSRSSMAYLEAQRSDLVDIVAAARRAERPRPERSDQVWSRTPASASSTRRGGGTILEFAAPERVDLAAHVAPVRPGRRPRADLGLAVLVSEIGAQLIDQALLQEGRRPSGAPVRVPLGPDDRPVQNGGVKTFLPDPAP